METENINIEEFLPATKKGKKRTADDDSQMQVDESSDTFTLKAQAPKAKRTKSDVRKLSVPPHR